MWFSEVSWFTKRKKKKTIESLLKGYLNFSWIFLCCSLSCDITFIKVNFIKLIQCIISMVDLSTHCFSTRIYLVWWQNFVVVDHFIFSPWTMSSKNMCLINECWVNLLMNKTCHSPFKLLYSAFYADHTIYSTQAKFTTELCVEMKIYPFSNFPTSSLLYILFWELQFP